MPLTDLVVQPEIGAICQVTGKLSIIFYPYSPETPDPVIWLPAKSKVLFLGMKTSPKWRNEWWKVWSFDHNKVGYIQPTWNKGWQRFDLQLEEITP